VKKKDAENLDLFLNQVARLRAFFEKADKNKNGHHDFIGWSGHE